MSNIIEKEIYCRECGQNAKTKLHTHVRVPGDEALREKLFEGSLMQWRCPSCGCTINISYPLLYSDLKRNFLIYLDPQAEKFCTVDEELEELYPGLSHLRRRTVTTLNALKEKVFCFENNLDDMALELAKLAVSRTVENKLGLKSVEEGYLSMYSMENNTMGFTFFTGENKEPYLQSTRLELYSKSARIVNKIATKDKETVGFLKIDREWADNIINRYNSGKKK